MREVAKNNNLSPDLATQLGFGMQGPIEYSQEVNSGAVECPLQTLEGLVPLETLALDGIVAASRKAFNSTI